MDQQQQINDLDQAIWTVEDLQAQLNYKQAKKALWNLVDNLDLKAEERSGLESELADLSLMLDKLELYCIHLAVFGMVGRGKSSLLNALLGEQVFRTGPVHGVTRNISQKTWSDLSTDQVQGITFKGNGNTLIELIDTPGIDEVDGATRARLALAVAKRADLLLFVISGDMTKVEYQALSELRELGKPILLVFNKIDQYPYSDRLTIYQTICDRRIKDILSPDDIVMVAASPIVTQISYDPQGNRILQKVPGQPQVQELKLKILEILHREGKSLVALNTMLFADNINEQVIQRKMDIRDQSANDIIWKGVMTKAMAIALNPITILDLITGGVIDVAIILSLSRLYNIPMTSQGAFLILQKIAISMGGITASELLVTFGLSSLKSLLGLATPITGGGALGAYLPVAMTQGAVAGVSSWAIGQVTKTYLANGASWGEAGPKVVISRILDNLDESSILNKIKQELQHRIVGNKS